MHSRNGNCRFGREGRSSCERYCRQGRYSGSTDRNAGDSGRADTKTFTDADVPCGESAARPCRCRASAVQNSFQYLHGILGPST